MTISRSGIPFERSGIFSGLFLEYAKGGLKEFYTYSADAAGILKFTEENQYTNLDRAVLVRELMAQNEGVALTAATKQNIESLKDSHAFTVTTGHQLCLATGPLYFIYKILSVINLCEELNKQGDKRFVPVYWMASEDHDFEEVNHIHLFNKKFTWQSEQKGRVGDFALAGIDAFLNEVRDVLGENENAKNILALLEKAYAQRTLAEATRYLVNALFGAYGLVIVDGNSRVFKKQFVEEIKKDAFEHFAFKKVSESIEGLKKAGYEAQVTPREINSFYTTPGSRERIVWENPKYKVLNTSLEFTREELEKKIETETEHFSPNVVLRPLYQQKILPNAVYVGGPGEIAYWLQYKTMFTAAGIALPVLMPRDFVLYIEKGLQQRIDKLGLRVEDLFNDKDKLAKELALKQQPFDLAAERAALQQLFVAVKAKAAAADKSLEATAEAELQKNSKSLDALEQKAIRAIKQKSEQLLNQLDAVHQRLLPGGVPQERVDNFIRYYLNNPSFIGDVKQALAGKAAPGHIVVLTEKE